MKARKIVILPAIILTTLFLVQCNTDEGIEKSKGEVAISMTDAPADNANVKGTFITVADVKVDGQSLKGFSKQTIEISAYHSGEVMLLVNHELEAGNYNEISIVLDNEHDANGNSPGCYVLTDNNVKHELKAEAKANLEVSLSKQFSVQADSMTNLIVDFDLRKSIVADTTNEGEVDYQFVSETEMNNAVRVVNEKDAGKIEGTVEGNLDSYANVYVYLYHKGEFNFITETTGSGNSHVLFANAVTSAKVNADGSYVLPFVEEGEYEVHVAGYYQGLFGNTFSAMLNVQSSILGQLLNSITVVANATTEVDCEVNSNS